MERQRDKQNRKGFVFCAPLMPEESMKTKKPFDIRAPL